jgi:hypothetical protein
LDSNFLNELLVMSGSISQKLPDVSAMSPPSDK